MNSDLCASWAVLLLVPVQIPTDDLQQLSTMASQGIVGGNKALLEGAQLSYWVRVWCRVKGEGWLPVVWVNDICHTNAPIVTRWQINATLKRNSGVGVHDSSFVRGFNREGRVRSCF